MIPPSWCGRSAGIEVSRTRCIGCWTSPSAKMTAGCATGRRRATSLSCARSLSTWSPETGAPKPASVAGARRLPGTTPTCSRSSHAKLMREPCNETWLVVIGASLFAAFPTVYAVFLGAFYMPVLLMLFGLIFRGIAFEFRYRSAGMRRFWDGGFFYGSVLVAFVQGAAVGAMMRGVPVMNMQYAGGAFDW